MKSTRILRLLLEKQTFLLPNGIAAYASRSLLCHVRSKKGQKILSDLDYPPSLSPPPPLHLHQIVEFCSILVYTPVNSSVAPHTRGLQAHKIKIIENQHQKTPKSPTFLAAMESPSLPFYLKCYNMSGFWSFAFDLLTAWAGTRRVPPLDDCFLLPRRRCRSLERSSCEVQSKRLKL